MTFLDQEKDYETVKQEWFTQWFNKSNSFNSLAGAKKSLKSYELFLETKYSTVDKLKIIQDLKALPSERFTQLYVFLNEYIQYLTNKKTHPKTIRIYFMFVRSFLRQWGIRIYNEDVKQFCNFPKQVKELRQPLTSEMINKLYTLAGNKYRSIILNAVSSGARIGEILQSKPQDYTPIIVNGKRVIQFRLRGEITKTREERLSFISNMAWDSMQRYMGKEYVYIKEWNKDTVVKAESAFNDLRERAGFLEKYSNGFNYHVNIHSFRSFFLTKATQIVGENIAHAWIGHHRYLDQYFRLPIEERALKYLEVEPEVSINLFKNIDNKV